MPIYTPHEDLKLIPEPDRLKWADALMTSVRHKESMSNEDDSAHCCLCVAERVLNGATFDDYKSKGVPDRMPNAYRTTSGTLLSDMAVATKGESVCGFVWLNDDHLSHPQIADLLRLIPVDTDDDKWRVQ